ncbi:MAG: 4Fe-4S binding protein [Candidatus Bathyarchaeia archaeon]
MSIEYFVRFCSSLPFPSAEPVMGAAGRTGSWRVYRPLIDKTKCTRCLLCWLYCPEGCVERTIEDDVEVNLDYCKGCGICAEECPPKAITMVREEA